MHLPLAEFYTMRLGEYWEAIDAHNKEKEADRRHMGELVRGAALRLFNIQVAPKSRISDPVKFWRMPWDEMTVADMEQERFDSMTDEQLKESAQNFLKHIGW